MKILLILLIGACKVIWGEPIWKKDPECDKFLELRFGISTAEHSIHFAEIGELSLLLGVFRNIRVTFFFFFSIIITGVFYAVYQFAHLHIRLDLNAT